MSGVLCDRRMKVKIKGKVDKATSNVYGAETWAVKKVHDKKMEVAEMKMLRWMCDVTRLDKIRNEKIRGSTKEEVGGLCERRSVRERTVRRGGVRPSCMEPTIEEDIEVTIEEICG